MSIKILLADDSITIQKVVGIIFGGEDYSLTVVDNGKSAVEKAREIDPDVLLIDALMPGMSGYEVCEAVRSTPALATKPILLLTGSFEPFDEDKAKTCGADDFIAKPFESQQIVSKVKELFELGKGRASAASSAAAPIPAAPVVPLQQAPVPTAAPIAAPQAESISFADLTPPAPTFQQPVAAPAPEVASPFETTSFAPEPAAAAPAIWDAFTPAETVAPLAATAAPAPETPAMILPNDDVFAMVQEELETAPIQAAVAQPTHPQHIDSQWVPVEEQTFEFAEEKVAELPPAIFDTPVAAVEPAAFGDISFDTPVEPVIEQTQSFGDLPASAFETAAPASFEASAATATSVFDISAYQEPLEAAAAEAFSAPAPPVFETAAPLAAAATMAPAAIATAFVAADAFEAPAEAIAPPVPTPAPTATTVAEPAALTEEQLKTALASVSKDVIERIVWEVVPDLAEVLIKEAIRKIKDGI